MQTRFIISSRLREIEDSSVSLSGSIGVGAIGAIGAGSGIRLLSSRGAIITIVGPSECFAQALFTF